MTGVLALVTPLAGSPTLLPVFSSALDDAGQPPTSGRPDSRWVVVDFDGLPMANDRLGGYSANVDGLVYVRCFGDTVREVAWAQEKTRAVLLDVVPTIPGRSVQALRMYSAQRPTPDRDEPTPLFAAVDVYTLFTAPAVGA
ncbi:hypothetical protein [Kineosporia sp. R_H_3]|uniref:hypothetical protein n=1 Tax=Kineosporia sp. R_H_3 TaxID=1961848 RepID=UPI00117A2518|nr:hypothetical protein [Kineosporia sp. R_H_3]